MRRYAAVQRFDQRIEIGLELGDLTEVTLDAQMHRSGRARGRDTECLTQEIRQARDGVDLGVELRHRIELRDIVDFLIRMAIARLRCGSAGDRDDRRAGHEAVAKSRCEIRGADHLRHAHAGFAACARIAVGHVRGCFLSVHHQPLDRHVLHFGKRFEHERGHEKEMRDFVAPHHFREQARAGHFRHESPPGAAADKSRSAVES